MCWCNGVATVVTPFPCHSLLFLYRLRTIPLTILFLFHCNLHQFLSHHVQCILNCHHPLALSQCWHQHQLRMYKRMYHHRTVSHSQKRFQAQEMILVRPSLMFLLLAIVYNILEAEGIPEVIAIANHFVVILLCCMLYRDTF